MEDLYDSGDVIFITQNKFHDVNSSLDSEGGAGSLLVEDDFNVVKASDLLDFSNQKDNSSVVLTQPESTEFSGDFPDVSISVIFCMVNCNGRNVLFNYCHLVGYLWLTEFLLSIFSLKMIFCQCWLMVLHAGEEHRNLRHGSNSQIKLMYDNV